MTKTQRIKNSKDQNLNNEELNTVKNQLARAMADYVNLQKRTDEEKSMMYKLTSISFMVKLLPILDNLKQAQNHLRDSGIAMIVGQFENLVKEEGFKEIEISVGDIFDEQTMEVVEALETKNKKDNNKVSEILLSGWKYADGTVVRHAKVKVYKFGT